MLPDSVPFSDEMPVAPFADGDGRSFDVFLSHNSVDKPVVERIAERLKRARLEPWLDSWDLVPGTDWQRGLAAGLAASRSCAVFVGPADLGAWANEEVAVALDRAATDAEFRVFLVLLPGLPERFDAGRLRPFLRMRTWVDYRGGLDDERAFQALVSAIKGLPLGPAVPIEPESGVSPYRGLEVFEAEHAEFFFGREADVQRLLEKLTATRFLAVLGASGSGKSSLVRAGLVPALRRDPVSGEKLWEIAILRPGAHPLEALAAQLLRLGPVGGMQQTLDALATDPRTLHLAGTLALAERPRDKRLLLIVDQFEEVFTLCRDERERSAFFANLLYAATIPEGGSGVLLAMRADFYHRCGAYPELAQQLSSEQYLVSPLQPDGLRQAVEEPARRVGLAFEPGLVATILDDVGDEPGALPLLEHALLEVWRRRTAGMLTLAGYRESGGVQGAIAKRADQVFESLEPGQQELARRAFLRLTQPGEGTEDTRRRAERGEFERGDAESVLTRLVDARLVTTSRDEASGGELVEVAHEALIRGWPRLQAWIDENRASLRVHLRLTDATREWQRLGRDESALYRGARLAEALEWRVANEDSLSDLERAFVAASRAAEEGEFEAARRRTRRLRALAVVLAVLLLATAVAALVAKRQTDRANAQRRSAEQATRASMSLALASASREQLSESPDIALLLALEAYGTDPAPQARDSLITALEKARGSRATTILRGHTGAVNAVAFAPDGRTLVSGSDDGTVRFWDIRGYRPLGRPLPGTPIAAADRLRGFRNHVLSVAFSHDGRTVASGEGFPSGALRLWDARTRRPLGPPLHTRFDVLGLAFSGDGRTLVTGGEGGTVRLWDVRTRRQVGRLGGSAALLASSPDGRTVATRSDDGSVRLWDVRTRRETGRLARPAGSVAFSPDGTVLASGGSSDGAVRLWHVRTQRQLGRPLLGHSPPAIGFNTVNGVAFSPDGRMLVSGGEDGTVRLWDVRMHRQIGAPLFRRPGDPVKAVTFSADGGTVASGAGDGRVRLFDVRAYRSLGQTLGPSAVGAVSVAFSPDGRTLAAGVRRGTVELWDARDHRRLASLRGDQQEVSSIAFSPDGRTLAVGGDGVVQLWDVPARRRLAPLRAAPLSVVNTVQFSHDGGTLVAAGPARAGEPTAVLFEARTRRRLGAPLRGGPIVSSLGGLPGLAAFGPDGRTLVAAGNDRYMRLWEVRTRRRLDPPVATARAVGAVAFSPDGRTIASASADFGDGAVRLWDASTRRQLGQALLGHEDRVGSLAFSPDGSTLASVSADGMMRLWDVATRHSLGAPLPVVGDEDYAFGVAFSPEGRTLATAASDGVRLWEGILWNGVGDVRAQVCHLVVGNLSRAEWDDLASGIPYRASCPS